MNKVNIFIAFILLSVMFNGCCTSTNKTVTVTRQIAVQTEAKKIYVPVPYTLDEPVTCDLKPDNNETASIKLLECVIKLKHTLDTMTVVKEKKKELRSLK